MLLADELIANRKKAEADFVNYFKGSYNSIDAWIREYDKWYRNEQGKIDYIGFYRLLDCTMVTPSEAGAVQYDKEGHIKAVQIKTMMREGKPVAKCQEGFYDGIDFVGENEPFIISFDRCFPIFVEMLEAYDNLVKYA